MRTCLISLVDGWGGSPMPLAVMHRAQQCCLSDRPTGLGDRRFGPARARRMQPSRRVSTGALWLWYRNSMS